MARILVASTGRVLSEDATFARTRVERARGLLARPPLSGSRSMVFEKTKQVHTLGMRYPLDVIFCSGDWVVLHVSRNVVPGRITRLVFRARYAIEMRAGAVPLDIAKGERLSVERA